jgi:hypothetical protein
VSAVDAVSGGVYPHKSMARRTRAKIPPRRLLAGRTPKYSEIPGRAGCWFLAALTVYYAAAK